MLLTLAVLTVTGRSRGRHVKSLRKFDFRCRVFPYSSWVHVEGMSIRWPSFSSLNSSSTGTPGYGEPPSVKISHSSTPKDHLQTETDGSGSSSCTAKLCPHIPARLEKWRRVILTHRFGVCICGRTAPQEPSTWLVNDPEEEEEEGALACRSADEFGLLTISETPPTSGKTVVVFTWLSCPFQTIFSRYTYSISSKVETTLHQAKTITYYRYSHSFLFNMNNI